MGAGPHDDRQAWARIQVLFLGQASQRGLHQACQATGVTPGAMRALLSLRPGTAVPMRELASAWRCDPSYVTSVVGALEQRGLVVRQVRPEDRRAKAVALTAEGERTLAQMAEVLAAPPAALAVLSPDEQATLAELLQRVLDALPADGGGPAGEGC